MTLEIVEYYSSDCSEWTLKIRFHAAYTVSHRITYNRIKQCILHAIDAVIDHPFIDFPPPSFSLYFYQQQFIRLPTRPTGNIFATEKLAVAISRDRRTKSGKRGGREYLQWSAAKFQLRVYQRLIRLSRPGWLPIQLLQRVHREICSCLR